jgi:hypothetical protein
MSGPAGTSGTEATTTPCASKDAAFGSGGINPSQEIAPV